MTVPLQPFTSHETLRTPQGSRMRLVFAALNKLEASIDTTTSGKPHTVQRVHGDLYNTKYTNMLNSGLLTMDSVPTPVHLAIHPEQVAEQKTLQQVEINNAQTSGSDKTATEVSDQSNRIQSAVELVEMAYAA